MGLRRVRVESGFLMTMTSRLGRSRQAMLAASVCTALVIGMTGCSSTHSEAAGAAAGGALPAAAGGTASRPVGPAVPAVPPASKLPQLPKGVSTARPRDPLAPRTVEPVGRGSAASHPTVKVKGGPQSFSEPVVYTDGVTLRITRMTHGKVAGEGPGVFPGRPVTDFYVTLTNHSSKTLTLDSVVVTVTYGSPARLAHLVYDQNAVDFAGAVKAGASARAVYGFAVPASDLGDVTMAVDLDGVHQLATFTGRAK